MMSQFVTSKNPPWVRSNASGLVQPPGRSQLLTAQQLSHASATGASLANAGLGPNTGLPPGAGNPLATAAAVVAAAQNQQAQQGPPVSVSYGTGLAAITLTQSALQQGAMLQQQGIAIPASLAATTQVANVNNGMVVEIARLPQPGVALPTSLATTQVATVSYPAPRLLAQTTQYQAQQAHPAVVQQAAAAVVQHQQPPQQQYKQRVFTGNVTKLHENFGFVDGDVFFQMSCVKGNMPKTGERVLVEASYNASSPFKWNATRIQVLPNQVIQNQVVQLNVQQTNSNQSIVAQQGPLGSMVGGSISMGMNVSQGMSMNAAIANMANNQSGYGNVSQSERWQMQREMVLDSLGQQQQQRLALQQQHTQHNWMQEMEFDIMDKNTRMARRHPSPPPVRRDLRRDDRRYRDRYSPPPRKRSRSPRRPSRSPPRRRQRVQPRYTVQIPKISLDMKTGNVMELRKRYSNLYVPSDFCAANFVWQDAFPPNRPFPMDHPCPFHIIGKDIEYLLDNDAVLEPSDADYSYSAKVMLMSTPPLDEIYHKSCALGHDSDEARENFVHPTRLISFLVGLKGKNETVAIGGPWSQSLDGPCPDKNPTTLVKTAIRTCKALTGIDLSSCTQWYRFAEIHYRRGESSSKGTRIETVVLFMPDVWSCLPTRSEWGLRQPGKAPTEDPSMEEEAETNEEVEKMEPTHYSELDPKTIKVNDLKRELEARHLSVKGLKSQLIARLTKALKSESEKDENAEEDAETETSGGEDEKKKDKEKLKDEKEKIFEKLNLPDSPAVLVQPSKTAKNGRFDCTIMSLSLLLDYRQEDNKEHSFEVSLFAELFNEMMMRDFGFRIYRALVESPELKEDEKDKKKNDKRKDDKEDGRKRRFDDDDMDYDSERDDDDSEDDDYDDDKRDKDKKRKRRKKPQMVTHDPFLLLSFIYYDQTHCGYILEKDMEEIFYTLGLMLSRAQVRKLIQKVCKRESFRYRKLTDHPAEAENWTKNESIKKNVEDLALGNKKCIPFLKEGEKKDGGENLVSFRGALVDVSKLMEQVERSHKARMDTDSTLKALHIQLDTMTETASAKEKLSQKLAADFEDQKQKLRQAEDELKRVRCETDRYSKVLVSLKENLQSSLHLVHTTLQKPAARSARNSPTEDVVVKQEPKTSSKAKDSNDSVDKSAILTSKVKDSNGNVDKSAILTSKVKDSNGNVGKGGILKSGNTKSSDAAKTNKDESNNSKKEGNMDNKDDANKDTEEEVPTGDVEMSEDIKETDDSTKDDGTGDVSKDGGDVTKECDSTEHKMDVNEEEDKNGAGATSSEEKNVNGGKTKDSLNLFVVDTEGENHSTSDKDGDESDDKKLSKRRARTGKKRWT